MYFSPCFSCVLRLPASGGSLRGKFSEIANHKSEIANPPRTYRAWGVYPILPGTSCLAINIAPLRGWRKTKTSGYLCISNPIPLSLTLTQFTCIFQSEITLPIFSLAKQKSQIHNFSFVKQNPQSFIRKFNTMHFNYFRHFYCTTTGWLTNPGCSTLSTLSILSTLVTSAVTFSSASSS